MNKKTPKSSFLLTCFKFLFIFVLFWYLFFFLIVLRKDGYFHSSLAKLSLLISFLFLSLLNSQLFEKFAIKIKISTQQLTKNHKIFVFFLTTGIIFLKKKQNQNKTIEWVSVSSSTWHSIEYIRKIYFYLF